MEDFQVKKKIIIAVFLMLSLTVSFILGSCADPDVKTAVTLTVKAGDFVFVNHETVTVSTASDNTNGPSVLDVIKTYIDGHPDTNIQINDTSLLRFGMYYETTYKDVTYYWSYTVNGNEPTSGKANSNYVKAGDEIVYSLVAMTTNTAGDSVVSDYDTDSRIFEDELYESSTTEQE